MMSAPLADQLIKHTGNWSLITVDASLATKLLGMDLTNFKTNVDLTGKVVAMIGAMAMQGPAEQKLLGASPLTQQQIGQASLMTKQQALGEAAIDLAKVLAPTLVADYLANLICEATGTNHTIVYVGAQLVTRTACYTAAKYMTPAAKQTYAGALQIYQQEGVRGIYNKACSNARAGSAYMASLPVRGFNQIVNAVSKKMGL